MATLRYDMSQYYPLKETLEEILGGNTYRKLKETGTLKDWRVECTRLLDALGLAAQTTVLVADDDWRAEMKQQIDHGRSLLAASDVIDELLACLCATLIRISFLQLGFAPSRRRINRVPLRKDFWKLDAFRSVQYVQTDTQRSAHEQFIERKRAPRGA
jgi:hypothetical protein